ncbi:MAG: response regulator [Bacteroidales bacterium]|jgi:DNA-binding response OmpR family regulator
MRKKILVIDDEITIRTLLDKFLSQLYEVTALGNGQEALTWLQGGNMPDLMIVDLEMPSMNGFEFLQQVKSSGFFRSIPVLMLSGVDSSAERVRCLKAGALDFMIKPFNPEELTIKIDILLRIRLNG